MGIYKQRQFESDQKFYYGAFVYKIFVQIVEKEIQSSNDIDSRERKIENQ